jgi:hypothetical protein
MSGAGLGPPPGAATSHTHTEANVTSLVTDLAGKAPISVPWAASTAYKAGQIVSYGQMLYVAKVDFTSGASFVDTDWTEVGRAPLGPSDHGFLEWSGDLSIGLGSTALATAGTVYTTKVRVRRPRTVTSVCVYVVTAGTGLTTGQCFGALWQQADGESGNAVMLRQSVDQAAGFAAGGLREMTLSSTVDVVTGYAYIGYWFNGSGGPGLARGGNTALVNAGLSSAYRWATADTGKTTTAPSPLGALTASNFAVWAALR